VLLVAHQLLGTRLFSQRPDFPSTILRPGKECSAETVFIFGIAR